MNLLHDSVYFGVVHPTARRAENALAPFPGRLNDRHLNLNLLSVGHTEIVFQFDGPAVDLAPEWFSSRGVPRFRYRGFDQAFCLRGGPIRGAVGSGCLESAWCCVSPGSGCEPRQRPRSSSLRGFEPRRVASATL